MPKSISIGISKKKGCPSTRKKIEKNQGISGIGQALPKQFLGEIPAATEPETVPILSRDGGGCLFSSSFKFYQRRPEFHIVANDTIQVEWTYKKDCQPEDNKTNIYLETFTTCWAQLKLYSVLEKIDRNVLYYDTDSVIYVSKTGENDVPLGDYLGELTNKLEPEEHIIEFVSGGPKKYVYKANKGNETCKVRGFTLNFTNSQLINFESVKTLVIDPANKSTITITNPHKICRNKG